MTDERRTRLAALIEAARTLQNPRTAEGAALRTGLGQTSGLSPQNIELGLARCLEARPRQEHLDQMIAETPEAPHAHVLLSGNVFVAALRAIALGVVSAPRVSVRASRRDPVLAEALHALTPSSFELTTELRPAAGERLWAYGSDATLTRVRAALPAGVWFHAHGSGLGAVVLDPTQLDPPALREIALDTALFDQRGCLSPRLVCVLGEVDEARDVAELLARELCTLERELPRSAATPEERAEARRQRDAALYGFELFDAGSGWISFGREAALPPSGRHLHVVPTSDPCALLEPHRRYLTCIGTNARGSMRRDLAVGFKGARLTRLGEMQRPPLDGPVDRRHGPGGELIESASPGERAGRGGGFG